MVRWINDLRARQPELGPQVTVAAIISVESVANGLAELYREHAKWWNDEA